MAHLETNLKGLNYLGTIDDVVERYPWRFKYDTSRLNHSLAVQLLVGRPILLNDGYLVNHSMGQKAVMEEDGLLWAMIEAGFVRIMSRGGDRYSLHEMPEVMQSHIESFRLLVKNKIPNVPNWKDLRTRLEVIDKQLREQDNIIGWPRFDVGSGYRVLALKLLEQGSTVDSVGMRGTMSNRVFSDFLSRFVDRMQEDTSGARNYWEQLAKEYADTPGIKNRKAFVRSLMNLANEMYHYNMGVMLSVDRDEPVSVETQASPAFDDLLVSKDILVDHIPKIPVLQIPQVVATAPPAKLVQVLRADLDLDVAKARTHWVTLKRQYEEEGVEGSGTYEQELREAAEAYAATLSEHLHRHIDYRKSESLFDYVIGELTEKPEAIAASMLGETVGQLAGVLGAGGVVGFAAGYIISRLHEHSVGVVTNKYRVLMLKNQMLPPQVVRKYQQVIERIKRRHIPSAIDIDKSRAQELVGRMKEFTS